MGIEVRTWWQKLPYNYVLGGSRYVLGGSKYVLGGSRENLAISISL